MSPFFCFLCDIVCHFFPFYDILSHLFASWENIKKFKKREKKIQLIELKLKPNFVICYFAFGHFEGLQTLRSGVHNYNPNLFAMFLSTFY